MRSLFVVLLYPVFGDLTDFGQLLEQVTVEYFSAIGSVKSFDKGVLGGLAAFLVFFMQAGFALVESGFTRAKNVCNIIMKNLMDVSIGSIVFWMFGFGLMFGISNGYIGENMFLFDGGSEKAIATGNSLLLVALI